jgi:hypothetical protein
MTWSFVDDLSDLGVVTTGIFLFLSLIVAIEIGYNVARMGHRKGRVPGDESSAVSTLTAGMLGLLAFTLSLSISIAQNRFEHRREMVLQEANAIGTAWLRTKMIDGDEGPAIAAKIEDFARVRLQFTSAQSDDGVPALIARTNALETEMWRDMQTVAHRAPNPVTTALINALNEMFDDATAQQFAYVSGVPASILLGLYAGSLLSIGALGYQFGVAGRRQIVLSSLLLAMWTGGMMLIVDLNLPRAGNIRADVTPLVWQIQSFGPK